MGRAQRYQSSVATLVFQFTSNQEDKFSWEEKSGARELYPARARETERERESLSLFPRLRLYLSLSLSLFFSFSVSPYLEM